MPPAIWTDEMIRILLSSLVQSVNEGKRAENGFKKDAWQKAKIEVNAVHGTKLEVTQLKTKYAALKNDYTVFHALKGFSGFGWDEELGVPTAPDSVWKDYVAKNPRALQFRFKAFPYYNVMDEL
ncbi:Myb/SANT-like DNA-binding domain-containing protein, partial [Geopyxis carbonaria]